MTKVWHPHLSSSQSMVMVYIKCKLKAPKKNYQRKKRPLTSHMDQKQVKRTLKVKMPTNSSSVLRHSKTGKMEILGTVVLNSCGDKEQSTSFSSSSTFSLSFVVAKELTSNATVLAAILAQSHARKHEKIQVSKERWRRLKWRTQSIFD